MTNFETLYNDVIKKALVEKFGYKNTHEIPKLTKIVLNMGVGDAVLSGGRYDNLLQKMGNEINYSPTYMSTKFKTETGETFKSFLQSVRIDAAISLLHETKMSVAEIASAVGYKDIKHFYSIFKKLTNLTPSQYRQ